MNQTVDPGHGHSPAAWVAVSSMIAALTAATVFVFLGWWTAAIVSGVLVFVGWGAGFVLAAAGWGVKGPKYQPKGH